MNDVKLVLDDPGIMRLPWIEDLPVGKLLVNVVKKRWRLKVRRWILSPPDPHKPMRLMSWIAMHLETFRHWGILTIGRDLLNASRSIVLETVKGALQPSIADHASLAELYTTVNTPV
jgi:hypothetical protein